MANIPDDQLLNLHELLKIVAFRANRLGEWTRLELVLRPLDRSLATLSSDAERATQQLNPPPGQVPDTRIWPKILETWSTLSNEDLQLLEDFIGRVQYIKQPLSSSPSDDCWPKLAAWMAEVDLIKTDIQTHTRNWAAPPLWSKSDEFREILKKQINSHRRQMEDEIGQLRTLTDRLQAKLEDIVLHPVGVACSVTSTREEHHAMDTDRLIFNGINGTTGDY